jgi:4-amino-4-deoxy-L-arabinose transferase-like glycosyltransferase
MPKNLVEAGKYATHYNKDYQMFNPVITTGPSVLLPIAFFFKLFGINYVVARLLMIVFYLLFLIILYFLVREFFGSFVAALSSISIGFLPTTLIMAINTIGEIPATLY